MKNGFTLIELSIVLIIIALIAGGIMVGQDLIAATKVRQQVSQIEEIRSASNTFKVKYGNLPADFPSGRDTAAGFTGSSCSGAGFNNCANGFIDGFWANALSVYPFFRHLRDANLISCASCRPEDFDWTGNTYDQMFVEAKIAPKRFIAVYGGPVPGGFGPPVTPQNFNANYMEIHSSVLSQNDKILPAVASALDSKLDDGLPLTGAVTVVDSPFYMTLGNYWQVRPATTGAAGSAACVSTTTTPNTYNFTGTTAACGIRFNAGF